MRRLRREDGSRVEMYGLVTHTHLIFVWTNTLRVVLLTIRVIRDNPVPTLLSYYLTFGRVYLPSFSPVFSLALYALAHQKLTFYLGCQASSLMFFL
ncbi:hypothetical protein EDB89DRAFT_2000797 [Lactarius sanguifluus]|nr:hypothetical protein EDB89DRAFT_2000797 [Lactarius sanguifluus]